MATKTISITEEAYRRLVMMRKANESFSEIITKITGKVNLNNYFGILSNESADKLEKAINASKKSHSKIHEKRLKELKEGLS